MPSSSPLLPPAFVINLDRSPGRLEHVRQSADVFEAMHRVSAVDKNDITDDEVREFREQAKETASRWPELHAQERVSMSYWRGSLAVFRSHIRAIETACLMYDRFVIVEDDATVRRDLLEASPAPEHARGVRVWGGAIPNGSYMTQRRRYHAWQQEPPAPNEWSCIPPEPKKVRNRFLATAYEMDSRTASEWLRIMRENPQAYDWAWWVCMLKIPTWVPDIEVIYQKLELGSDRSPQSDRSHRRHALTKIGD